MENYQRFYKIGAYLGYFYILVFSLMGIYQFLINFQSNPPAAIAAIIFTLVFVFPIYIGSKSLYKEPDYNWINNIFASLFVLPILLFIIAIAIDLIGMILGY